MTTAAAGLRLFQWGQTGAEARKSLGEAARSCTRPDGAAGRVGSTEDKP